MAWLQRCLGLGACVASVLAAWWTGQLEWPWPCRLLLALLLLLPHAPVLAFEFLLLARFGNSHPAARPTAPQLLRAWWGEVWMGVLTFGWRQPWRPGAEPDHLPPEGRGRRGVLLVHGFVCNRGLWTPWLRSLRASGTPVVAINLEPVFGSIDDYVPLIESAVARLEKATGLPPLIVAHSMGGLATRAWLREHSADARCAGVVTIGSPHHGTWLARFAVSPNGRQMRRGNRWLEALAAQEPLARRERFTCFYGHCDNIVFPAATAMLEGADNRHLAGTAHVDLVCRPEVFAEVSKRLGA